MGALFALRHFSQDESTYLVSDAGASLMTHRTRSAETASDPLERPELYTGTRREWSANDVHRGGPGRRTGRGEGTGTSASCPRGHEVALGCAFGSGRCFDT